MQKLKLHVAVRHISLENPSGVVIIQLNRLLYFFSIGLNDIESVKGLKRDLIDTNFENLENKSFMPRCFGVIG